MLVERRRASFYLSESLNTQLNTLNSILQLNQGSSWIWRSLEAIVVSGVNEDTAVLVFMTVIDKSPCSVSLLRDCELQQREMNRGLRG